MGVLGVNGSDPNAHIDPPEPEEAPAAAETTDRERNEQGQFVPAEKLQPETAASRRERLWRERVEAAVAPMKQEWEGKLTASERALEELRQERARDAQERARLQGMLETLQRQPQQAPQPQQQGPDPAELRRQAKAQLQAGNFDEYDRLNFEANEIIADRKAEAKLKAFREEMQRNQPAQLPPHIQALMFQNQHVMGAGEKGIRKVLRAADDLVDDGMDRQSALVEAFRRTNEAMAPKKTPTAPTYSRESASALAGVPTGRPGAGPAGNSGDGVRLTDAQEAAYNATKSMWKDRADYLKWSDPGKYGLTKQ